MIAAISPPRALVARLRQPLLVWEPARARNLRVDQGSAEVQHVAGGFPHQREGGRPAGGQAAGQRIFLEGEHRLELLRQALHPDIVGRADDVDRLDPVVARGALDALEQLLADAAPPVALFDRKRRLGVDVPPERRLLAPDRLIGAQLGRADQAPVDKSPVQEIALAEAMLGVMDQEVIRHAAAKALVPAALVEPQQMIAERVHVRRPQAPDFDIG